jgi:GT2 family glycosyltransferase
VIVPTKGRPRYLQGCLAALAAADYPRDRFEVVVVNDGGGAAVEEVVEHVAGAIEARLTAPPRTGPSAARNAGAWAARGRHLAFTDDDCEPAAGWLPALERALADNPRAAVGGVVVNGARRDPAAVASQAVVDSLLEEFNRDPAAPRFFTSSNLAFPAEPFREIGGFDEAFRYAEDREICHRWIRSGHRLAHAPDAIVHHMRTLTLRDFVRQHHGYGRGAWAFQHHAPDGRADSPGVLRALARRALHPDPDAGRIATTAYVALSQAATASGFAREAVAGRVRRWRHGTDRWLAAP